jgi:hypothetical protein
MKDRPASALRAMFAGIGSLLHGKDKVRSKPAEQAPTETGATAPGETAPEAATAESTAEPEATAVTEAAEAVAEAEPVAEVVAEPTAEVEADAETEAEAEPEVEVAVETVVIVAESDTEIDLVEIETIEVETDAETDIVVVETVVKLPLSNYDESSVASLRARLRNLSVEELTQLIEYEKGNANRADVVTMFERRIVKVQAEG